MWHWIPIAACNSPVRHDRRATRRRLCDGLSVELLILGIVDGRAVRALAFHRRRSWVGARWFELQLDLFVTQLVRILSSLLGCRGHLKFLICHLVAYRVRQEPEVLSSWKIMKNHIRPETCQRVGRRGLIGKNFATSHINLNLLWSKHAFVNQ